MQHLRIVIVFCAAAFLSGCITGVDYGKIPHEEFVADARCSPAESPSDLGDKPLFIVTSRLADCRNPDLTVTAFRADRLRYGRFSAPVDQTGKKAEAERIPLSFVPEANWWRDLATAAVKDDGRILLYVHGFNESLLTSGRDTAQIGRLTDTKGPVILYTWPSRNKLVSYGVDETNMYWDERNFRNFLSALAELPETREIVIVAHSLGARLVIPAIAFVDRNTARVDSANIAKIILASPDIDSQNFERDIASDVLSARRVADGREITIYVSDNDRALNLSRRVHGYPRLGEPHCFNPKDARDLKAQGKPERCYISAPANGGMTIVDTSAISRGGSGHSNYLRAAVACRDFAAVVRGEMPADRAAGPARHVFLLPAPAKGAEVNDDAVCMRWDQDLMR
ncbi:MAG: alpha/beta hydrolase [Parasphingorhabdus sp.]|nr:alpha/beta hydrolase [Parasphingorhabdus sp.]